jgi:hypothetical protein
MTEQEMHHQRYEATVAELASLIADEFWDVFCEDDPEDGLAMIEEEGAAMLAEHRLVDDVFDSLLAQLKSKAAARAESDREREQS